MWTCIKCGENVEEQFASCWKCGTDRLKIVEEPTIKPSDASIRRVGYRIFRGVWKSWERLFAEAAEFATEVGPARLISISHSEDQNDSVVTVWFWTDGDGGLLTDPSPPD